jgi:hypothetical protein
LKQINYILMSSKSNKELTTNYTDLKVDKIEFTKLEKNERTNGQKLAYPRYKPNGTDEVPLFIQFPWIEMKTYGVPSYSKYVKEEKQRTHVKVPLDESVPEVKELCDLIHELDETLGSKEFKATMFGDQAGSYEYQPIYREPQPEEESESKEGKKKTGPRYPFIKLKIDTTFPELNVKTRVFTSVLGENGKRVRTPVTDIKTIDDFAAHVCWLCRFRPVVRPVKFWAESKPLKKGQPMAYGLAFKIAKVEVEPPTKTGSNYKEYLESDAFLDDDEESDTIETVQPTSSSSKSVQPSNSTQNTSSSKGKQIAEVESENESGDEESEEEPVTKTVAKAPVSTKKPVAAVESEGEEDEEDVKPPKKPVGKAPVQPAKTTTTASKTKKANA